METVETVGGDIQSTPYREVSLTSTSAYDISTPYREVSLTSTSAYDISTRIGNYH